MKLSVLLLSLAATLAAQVAGPRLGVSLNQSSAAAIFPGWPVVAEVSIANSAGTAALRLAPSSSVWPLAIRFAVTGPSGKPEDWRFELSAQPPDPAITLPARSRTSVFLVLDPEKTASLPAGVYVLTAGLEIGGSDGWNGLVRSPVARVEVKESKSLTPDQELELTLLRATVQLLRKQNAEAKRILSDYLAVNSDAVPAFRMIAELLEDEGDFARAYVYASLAMKSYAASQTGSGGRVEPPGQLLSLRNRLWRKALEATP
jgi:hypothetical protein